MASSSPSAVRVASSSVPSSSRPIAAWNALSAAAVAGPSSPSTAPSCQPSATSASWALRTRACSASRWACASAARACASGSAALAAVVPAGLDAEEEGLFVPVEEELVDDERFGEEPDDAAASEVSPSFEEAGAAPPEAGVRNTTTFHRLPSDPTDMPMPTCVKAAVRMLARWPGDPM